MRYNILYYIIRMYAEFKVCLSKSQYVVFNRLKIKMACGLPNVSVFLYVNVEEKPPFLVSHFILSSLLGKPTLAPACARNVLIRKPCAYSQLM